MFTINTSEGMEWVSGIEDLKDYVDPSIYSVIDAYVGPLIQLKNETNMSHAQFWESCHHIMDCRLHSFPTELEVKVEDLQKELESNEQFIKHLENDLSAQDKQIEYYKKQIKDLQFSNKVLHDQVEHILSAEEIEY